MTAAATQALALVRSLKPSAKTPKGALSQFLPACVEASRLGVSRKDLFARLVKAGLVGTDVTYAQFGSAISHALKRQSKREVVS